MIKKSTGKVIFGKKKESDHFCLCNILESWAVESFFHWRESGISHGNDKNLESKFHWQVIWNPIFLESGIHLRAWNPESKSVFYYLTWGLWQIQGRGPGARPSLFLHQTEARSAEKNFSETSSPFYPGLDDPPPFSEGLNPPLVTPLIFFYIKWWKKSCNTNNTFKRFSSLICSTFNVF